MIPKDKFLKLIKSVYLAFYQLRPDLIGSFIVDDASSSNVYIGRGQAYSLNDFQEYVFKEILGKTVLSQPSAETDLVLRKIYQLIMHQTFDGNMSLKERVDIDHHTGHLALHKIDEIVRNMQDY
jgi:hypothetical protein